MPLPPYSISDIADNALRLSWRVMTAESCTGGLVAAALTDGAGASGWFNGGVVVYSNLMKRTLLGVPAETLEKFGAVSEQTAAAMCMGLKPLGADAGLAITGVAGPDGGNMEKPVGMVCFGWLMAGKITTKTAHFDGDRASVRAQATHFALERLSALLSMQVQESK